MSINVTKLFVKIFAFSFVAIKQSEIVRKIYDRAVFFAVGFTCNAPRGLYDCGLVLYGAGQNHRAQVRYVQPLFRQLVRSKNNV